jgi:TIR domain
MKRFAQRFAAHIRRIYRGAFRTWLSSLHRSPANQEPQSSTVTDLDYDIFLRHSSKDKPAVRELAERLKADGLRVWFDDWVIKPGDSIPLAIEQGLENSRTLVLVMSEHSIV